MLIEANDLREKIDFGIITVIKEEFEAVLEFFPPKGIIRGNRDYVFSTFQHSKYKSEFKIAIVKCVGQGNGQSQKVTADLIADLSPEWIILCGIAGGIPSNDFSLGDIVIADRDSLDATVGAEQIEKTTFGIHGIEISQSVENLLGVLESLNIKRWTDKINRDLPNVKINDALIKGSDAWREKIKETLKKRFPKKALPRKPLYVHGPHSSSDQLRKNPFTIEDFFLDSSRKICAFEMELAGVCKAAGGKYPVLAIRGISDIIGFARDQAWTEFASHSAAAFTHTLIEIFPYNPKLENVSLHNSTSRDWINKESLLTETLSRISSNIENSKYKQHIFQQDAKSFYNLLQDQCSITEEDMKKLIPLSSMCGGCGRGEDNYITLRDAFIFITGYLLENFEDGNSKIKFLSRISRGEHYFGNKEKSKELASKALSEKIEFSDELSTHEERLTAAANHDTTKLEFSKRKIALREGFHGRESKEYVNAQKCLACVAIGMNHPNSEEYLSEFEETFKEFKNSSERAEWERSFEIMKTVWKFNSNKADVFSNKEKAVSALQQLLNWTSKTEFNFSRPNKAFVNWLLFKLTNESSYLIEAKSVLSSLGKRSHCLFDFENLRKQVIKDFQELKK